jgi:hypothetical protein
MSNIHELAQKVRLRDWEVEAVIETFNDCFNAEDELWLFGSRANLSKKGGDIDLFIDSKMGDVGKILEAKIDFLVKLKRKIGVQKIDVVLKYDEDDLFVFRVARAEGVRLK